MRKSRRENQQMVDILWGFMQKIDTTCEYTYYKGTNGLMRWLINYLDRTHPGWNDPPPKFQPLQTGFPAIDGPDIMGLQRLGVEPKGV